MRFLRGRCMAKGRGQRLVWTDWWMKGCTQQLSLCMRSDIIYLLFNLMQNVCCPPSLTNMFCFFLHRAPLSFPSTRFALMSWTRGRFFTTTGPAGGNGTNTNLWTTSESTLERRLHSTLPGWVNINSYSDILGSVPVKHIQPTSAFSFSSASHGLHLQNDFFHFSRRWVALRFRN